MTHDNLLQSFSDSLDSQGLGANELRHLQQMFIYLRSSLTINLLFSLLL